jgi:hypothetical protein
MESLHYQINTDRVIPSEKIKIEYLTCFLCKNILWQPEKCAECNIHSCKYCIKFSLLKTKKCPSCLCDYNSKSADFYLNEDLKDLVIKCIYSFNGCNKAVEYDLIQKHENECIYKEQICEECNKKILKKNYHTHIILCKNSVSNNLQIDYGQIIFYFKDKLNKIDRENTEDLEKIKKNFVDVYNQKMQILNSLLEKLEKQQNILEEIAAEREKAKNIPEDELKIFEGSMNVNLNNLNEQNFTKHNLAINESATAANSSNLSASSTTRTTNNKNICDNCNIC